MPWKQSLPKNKAKPKNPDLGDKDAIPTAADPIMPEANTVN